MVIISLLESSITPSNLWGGQGLLGELSIQIAQMKLIFLNFQTCSSTISFNLNSTFCCKY